MRRLTLALSIMAVVGLALTYMLIVPTSEAGASPAMQNLPVNIRVGCNGGDLGDTNISPYALRLRKSLNQRARFNLQGGSDVTSVIIRVKEDSSWPFNTADPNPEPPFTLQRGGNNAVTTGPIDPDAEGPYLYDIIADCGAGPQVIDPRMIIDP